MGVGVSGWGLARAVSLAGGLGVVSGVGLDTLVARRLQLGDRGGHLRRALAAFPYPEVAGRVLQRYFVAGGICARQAFAPTPMAVVRPGRRAMELAVVANFAEVFLAKVDDLLTTLVPAFAREGKSYLTVAMGCTGGRHRSVVLAEELGRRLGARGVPAAVFHRDVDR